MLTASDLVDCPRTGKPATKSIVELVAGTAIIERASEGPQASGERSAICERGVDFYGRAADIGVGVFAARSGNRGAECKCGMAV